MCIFANIVGMWGAKIFQRRLAIKRAARGIFYKKKHKVENGFDQMLLTQFVWPLASKDVVSLRCKIITDEHVL